MRQKHTAAIAMIALVSAISFSLTGQEDPLPVFTARATPAAIPLALPAVALAVEPVHELPAPTLADAARANDYVTFSALYANASADDAARFATLHELWTYAVTDPIGAFYGEELYRKLSASYPGYAAYIEQHRIVDQHGNVFYPTSETRTFLLDRTASIPPVAPPAPRRTSPQVATRDSAKPARTDAAAPKQLAPPAETAAPAPVPAPVSAPVAAPVPAPVAVVAESTPAPAPVAAPQPVVTSSNPAGRGILLIMVGLIGVGLLALILRTPGEQPVAKIVPDNVEPLRKLETPQATPTDSRATGSHG